MKASFKLWPTVAIWLALLAQPLQAEILYVTNWAGNSVSAYRIGENGALTPVDGSPFTAGKSPDSVAVNIWRRFLYVANIGDNTVSAYRIGQGGALTLVGVSPAGITPTSVAVDPFGRFVYAANQGSYETTSDVSAYRIRENGALTPVARSPFPAGTLPSSVVADPRGRFVYVANAGDQEVSTETTSGYRVEGNGTLTRLAGSPFPDGESTQTMAADPFGRFLYTAGAYDLAFSVYRISGNGTLTLVVRINPFGTPLGDQPNNTLAADPFGRFVYVASLVLEGNPSSAIISAYRIGGNGTVKPVVGSPFHFGFYSNCMVVDFFGQFLYAASGEGISIYRISGNGALTPVVAGSPFHTGFSTRSMAVSP